MVSEIYDDVISDLFNDSLEFRESTRYTRKEDRLDFVRHRHSTQEKG